MKQHISIDQLNELSEKGKERLREWWKPEVGDFLVDKDGCEILNDVIGLKSDNCLPLLSIGQMIEFLGTFELHLGFLISKNQWHLHYFPSSPDPKLALLDGIDTYGDTVCDSLWEAVKEVLEK